MEIVEEQTEMLAKIYVTRRQLNEIAQGKGCRR